MTRARTEAACLQSAARDLHEHTPSYTLDKQIAQARREMGPEKWARLNAEWNRQIIEGDL